MNQNEWRQNLLQMLVLTGTLAAPCSKALRAAEPGGATQTPFQNEAQFLVQTTVSELAREMFYAKSHQLPALDGLAVKVTERSGASTEHPTYQVSVTMDSQRAAINAELTVQDTIWTPETYQDLARKLAQNLDLSPAPPPQNGDTQLLSELTDAKAVTLEQKNQSVSLKLENDFNNPVLHEEAAVLLGAFALREHSGAFFDVRQPLCRLAAELSMAQFLSDRKPPGVNGRLANIMLLTLTHNETAALERLNQIDREDPALAAWANALYAANTYDYRKLDAVTSRTLLERIAWFEAFSQSVSKDQAWKKLSSEKTVVPDYCRLALQGSFTVGLGHDLLPIAAQLDMRELAAVYDQYHHQKLDRNGMITALNETPTSGLTLNAVGKPAVRIIDWGLWSAFLQRQLCASVSQCYDLLQNKWGVPDEAARYAQSSEQLFGDLRLYPFANLSRTSGSSPNLKSGEDRGTQLITASPQLVPDGCWKILTLFPLPQGVSGALLMSPGKSQLDPHTAAWFNPPEPPGTAYNIGTRRMQIELQKDALASLSQLHKLAPYDMPLSQNLYMQSYIAGKFTVTASNLAKLALPFSVPAMVLAAKEVANNPGSFESLMTNAADLNPDLYFELGDYFQDRKDDERASRYYDRGDALGAESLLSADRASWRISYKLRTGQTNQARQIAKAAGEVYSYDGLMAKARFFEATGEYAVAYDWYAKIQDRYGNVDPVVDFCLRLRGLSGDAALNTKIEQIVPKYFSAIFPDGLQKAVLADFRVPPHWGVVIKGESPALLGAGLKKDDIIMAVNGIRVRNARQYHFARFDAKRPDVDIIFWDGTAYKEIANIPPQKLFDVRMEDQTFDINRQGLQMGSRAPSRDVDQADAAGNTPLFRAARANHESEIRNLLAAGADIHATNHQGQTVLHFLLSSPIVTKETLTMLLNAKTDVNAQDPDGMSPLHTLARTKDDAFRKDSVQLLLAAGANPNSQDKAGRTPAHLFFAGDFPWGSADTTECIRLLKEANADLSMPDHEGKTPLHYLAALGPQHPLSAIHNLSDVLEKAHIDCNPRDNNSDTPADIAARNGTLDVLGWLAERGADLDATNRSGATPRQMAARRPDANRSLIPELNLYEAIHQDRADCVAALIKACPEMLNEPRQMARTPLAYAILMEKPNAIAVLKKLGAHQ